MASEDITFCANTGCKDMGCERNTKHIRLDIPHSFALFPDCKKWEVGNETWLTDERDGDGNG